ncbi:hypothetical protein [Micromonospora sp. WP24]|uniref:hypothetical protein n=1 Tax=Micromonospora sp. WP24 TaxID=2604469 RepID=UPI0016521230|nr:hypothetical protein [Micromonospora sp. WP24]
MTHRVHRAGGDRRDRPPAIDAPAPQRARRATRSRTATPTGHTGAPPGGLCRAG